MAILEVVEGQHAGQRYAVDSEACFGRPSEDASADDGFIPLPESKVSRRHARIVCADGRYLIEDLNSKNGTYVQGTAIKPGHLHALCDGDLIQICSTQLVFRDGMTRPAAAGPANDGGEPANADQGYTSRLSLILTDQDELQRELSMVLDASQLMQATQHIVCEPGSEPQEALKRLQAMAQVSITLGAETDEDVLMGRILDCIFDIFPRAERAFVLLRHSADAEDLVPVAARSRHDDGARDEIAISRSIFDEVLQRQHSILSCDAMDDKRFQSKESILLHGIRAVMCAPLIVNGEVLGLVQVDTARDRDSFTAEDLHVLTGISAQVAIALKNLQLYADIEGLFKGFVRASVQVIEARDPTTAGHSFRVAEYTERLASAVDRTDHSGLRDICFNREQMREIRYAALLHDFGKVGVREPILIKAKKLFPHQLQLMQDRFRYARANLERLAHRRLLDVHQERNISPEDMQKKRRAIGRKLEMEFAKLDELMALVMAANEPSVSHEDVSPEFKAMAKYTFPNQDEEMLPLVSDFEFEALTLSLGSLTPEERTEIESHVTHTHAFLNLIPWTKDLARVPEIARAHHEKLDGSGYPGGLRGDEIPIQARIMTIADIYDALTSGDRPYKKAMSTEQALDLLAGEAKRNKIEQAIFDVFVDSRAYRPVHGW